MVCRCMAFPQASQPLWSASALNCLVKHCPKCESVKHQLHHDGTGPCIPTTLTSNLGFSCRQLRLKLLTCSFQVALIFFDVVSVHLYIPSCYFCVLLCHLQLTADLTKTQGLLLNYH
jgi:hypothetical protein